jgi:hypothetical protein
MDNMEQEVLSSFLIDIGRMFRHSSSRKNEDPGVELL